MLPKFWEREFIPIVFINLRMCDNNFYDVNRTLLIIFVFVASIPIMF